MIYIDKDKNLVFYNAFIPCNCSDCKNFCRQIKSVSRNLTDFFAKNNVDIEKPFNLVSLTSSKNTHYISCQYLIFGECPNDFQITIDGIILKKETDGHPSTDDYETPNFILDFSVTLPSMYN